MSHKHADQRRPYSFHAMSFLTSHSALLVLFSTLWAVPLIINVYWETTTRQSQDRALASPDRFSWSLGFWGKSCSYRRFLRLVIFFLVDISQHCTNYTLLKYHLSSHRNRNKWNKFKHILQLWWKSSRQGGKKLGVYLEWCDLASEIRSSNLSDLTKIMLPCQILNVLEMKIYDYSINIQQVVLSWKSVAATKRFWLSAIFKNVIKLRQSNTEVESDSQGVVSQVTSPSTIPSQHCCKAIRGGQWNGRLGEMCKKWFSFRWGFVSRVLFCLLLK